MYAFGYPAKSLVYEKGKWGTSILLAFLLGFRFESVQQELSNATAQNKELQREMERLQSEVTRFKTMQLKAAKDAEKYKEERDSVFNEYRLIMSERDQVIKEVDKLQTELELAESKLKNTSSEKRVASEEMEALRQVLTYCFDGEGKWVYIDARIRNVWLSNGK